MLNGKCDARLLATREATIRSWGLKRLRERCKAYGLATDVDKAGLAKNLLALRSGGSGSHVHGKTMCPMGCGGFGVVNGTREHLRYFVCNRCGYKFKIGYGAYRSGGSRAVSAEVKPPSPTAEI